MPISGGAADKLGNRYEALWAIDRLLRIVDGEAVDLTLEPLSPEESRGIEFVVQTADGLSEYWSVKRQTTKAAGWTLAVLARDEAGRSILGDLVAHLSSAPKNRAIFASTQAAAELDELRAHAATAATFQVRLERSATLKANFQNHLLPIAGGDPEAARELLLRMRTHASDEQQLGERLDFAVRKLFYAAGGGPVDPEAVRGHLAALLVVRIHHAIHRDEILEHLVAHGVRLRDWSIDHTTKDQVEAICARYVEPLKAEWVNGALFDLGGGDLILDPGFLFANRGVLVSGGAGAGKSSTLAAVVERLKQHSVPVLPIRLDQVSETLSSTGDLGHRLLLPESPAMVLAGVANGARCVLIVDQLDAVSTVSGRRVQLWSIFDDLRREADRFPNMALLVGCREFDLEHDYRMRRLKTEGAGFVIVPLRPLSSEQLDNALITAGIACGTIEPTLKAILIIPLHLAMFLRLDPGARTGVRNRDELFDSFWTEAERRTDDRLGRKTAWTKVIDKLLEWLSHNQQLSAPQHVVDEVRTDAEAMASEHVLVLADGRYRFFHESFFDYAYARRFAAKGQKLWELLRSGEQHLFRRAQVRQVLTYLRAKDFPAYITELQALIAGPDIRFHLKRLIFQWLSTLLDPRSQEWDVLLEVATSRPELRSHILSVVAGQVPWFDVIGKNGFYDTALSSGDEQRESEAISMFAMPPIMEHRSDRVASLLQKHRRKTGEWVQYQRHICRFGHVHHSREMFDLFLSLIDAGDMDGLRPGFAVNDDWWSLLYSMARERPELASETIGHWLDRAMSLWKSQAGTKSSLSGLIDAGGNGTHVIQSAARAALEFAEHVLPRVARIVEESAEDRDGFLPADQVWRYRSFGDSEFQTSAALLSNLARALESLAKADPSGLDRVLKPHEGTSSDTMSFLLLRAWTAAPEIYGSRIVDYLIADPRRLKVGYSSWGGGGASAEDYVSIEALKAGSRRCSADQFSALEEAILSLSDQWEAKNPRYRGLRQLGLLSALDPTRLTPETRKRLVELTRKFPNRPPAVPEPLAGGYVGPPISDEAQLKMSDDQWLRAMHKYRNKEHSFDNGGGMRELAMSLSERAKLDPKRWIRLAQRMDQGLPADYFEFIVRGVAESAAARSTSTHDVSVDELASLVRIVHALPGKPCGRALAWLIQKWRGICWPSDVVEVFAWYAAKDPDPTREEWLEASASGSPFYQGDPYTAGINSARGAMAEALGALLFDDVDRLSQLSSTIESLVNDPSIAVRSCAISSLLPVLNVDVARALAWFKNCVSLNQAVLNNQVTERFVHYAGYRDYTGIRPVLERMLESEDSKTVAAAARQVSLLSLTIAEATADAAKVHSESQVIREAAAHVYARNAADKGVGEECRRRLKPFLSDAEVSVRDAAATVFRQIPNLNVAAQAELLLAFLNGNPSPEGLASCVRVLENSPVQLPDLVCRLAETCMQLIAKDAGDFSKATAIVGMDLAKIVVRLYAQTEDEKIQSRCLSLIDEMERNRFIGLSEELQRLDR